MVDETGLSAPISISLVVPVRFGEVRGEAEWGLEEQTFNRILREVSQLVDLGYLDELIVVDGTVGPERRPDFLVLQQVVRIAYEEIGLFHDQVEMLRKYKVQGELARRGYANLFVKVIHQFDRNLQKVLLRYGVSGLVWGGGLGGGGEGGRRCGSRCPSPTGMWWRLWTRTSSTSRRSSWWPSPIPSCTPGMWKSPR